MIELLAHRAVTQPDDLAYTFLHDGDEARSSHTWSSLERQSRLVAQSLRHLPPGSRALLLFAPGLEFIEAFFGCLYAGVIAVPAALPSHSRAASADARLAAIMADATPDVILTTRDVLARPWPSAAGSWTPIAIAIDELEGSRMEPWGFSPGGMPDDIAFLQYTSGSTAEPRGVMVTHGNLLHNLAGAFSFAPSDASTVFVSWLPVTHDMGLIEGVLQPMFSGRPAYLMSPAAFLQRPARWLQAISRYRATRSGGPNFAYELCSRRIDPVDRDALDLRSWRAAFNGAEPIRLATLQAFASTFASSGFSAEAFHPCYGLAESTLLVASAQGIAADASGRVSCGRPIEGARVLVVDPSTGIRCRDNEPGELWVAGPSVARGYWGRPDDTTRIFGARLPGEDMPFLRTGDLGVANDGALRITGRIKDVLIVRGVKHFPQDLELTAEAQDAAIRLGSVAAVSMGADASGDWIALVAEVDPRKLETSDAAPRLIRTLRAAVADGHGVQLHSIALIRPGTIPKTTSGKLRRFACREALAAGELPIVADWRARSDRRSADDAA